MGGAMGSKKMVHSKKISIIYRYCILATLLFGLCFLFPYTGDDWAWGSSIGLERLSSWFDNYSGRYLGNLIVLALTRSRLLRAIVMALTFSGIAYCIERITQREWAFYFAVLSLLCLPRLVLRQAVVWTAGFSNYSTSIFLMLLFICYLMEHNDPAADLRPRISCIVYLLILGFCNSLIVEHMTVFNVFLAVSMIPWWYKNCKRIPRDYLAYASGAILGAGLMFSNSVYHSISQGADEYRKIAGGGVLRRAAENYFNVIYREAYFNNIFLNTVIFVVCLLLFLELVKKKNSKKLKMIGSLCVAVMSLFWLYSIDSRFLYGERNTTTAVLLSEGFFTAANVLATIILSVMITTDKKIKQRIIMMWVFAFLVIGPLFVVTPIGSRCFFASYVFLTLIACEMIKSLLLSSEARPAYRFPYTLCICAIAAVFTVYATMFVQVYTADQKRIDSIMEAYDRGESSAILARLPHEKYLWTSYPHQDNDLWEQRFKLFYGIPDDLDLTMVK